MNRIINPETKVDMDNRLQVSEIGTYISERILKKRNAHQRVFSSYSLSFPHISGKKVLAFMAIICISVSLNASTIHWITFINTDEPNIGEPDKNAKSLIYDRLVRTVNMELSQYGYDYKMYDYYSGNFTKQDCMNVVNNIKCDTNDIIVFYYIGHGRRLSKDTTNKYPTLFFDTDVKNGIPLSWIHQSLKDKKARLTLTIAVSSNTYLEGDQMSDITDVLLPSVQNCSEIPQNASQYKSSIASGFLGYKGDIIICSASPDQCSWAAQTPLGIMDVFTYVFISSYESKMFSKDFLWSVFLKDVSESTEEATKDMPLYGVQTPIFDYNLKRMYTPNK